MSGFGRCGEWFAWQRYGEAGRPDLMTLAKGLTGAHLPLGAVVLSAPRSAPSSSTRCSTPGSPTAATRWPAPPGSPRVRAYEEERPDRALAARWARSCYARCGSCRRGTP